MTKQIFFISLIAICLFSCLPDSNNNGNSSTIPDDNSTQVIPSFEVEFPDDYKILTQASGDLTKDGVDEKVLVLNTGEIGDMGEKRVLLVFQIENGDWKMIHRASGPILPSEHGGVMGDPLQSVGVENGAIVIKHFGGSREKWDNTHRYRLQNDNWDLIGATLITESPCLEREKFDYNLSSGRVMYNHVKLICDNGEDARVRSILSKAGFVSKMETLPQMNGFEFGKIYAINPRTGSCIPKNNCYEVETNEEPIVNEPTTNNETNETSNNETPVILPTGETNEEPTTTTSSDHLDLNELIGIYTASRNDQSWILTIFPQKGKMEVSYYKVAGLLDDIELIIEGYTPEVLKKFEISKADNTIQSDLGKGKLSDFEGKPTLTFFDVKSDDGHQLELIKDEAYGF